MPDLEGIRRAITERRVELARELEPLVTELELLREVLQTIDGGVARPVAGRASSPRGDAKPAARSRSPGLRPKRAEQALRLIGAQPGITPAELGRWMKINPQYLYRVLPNLVKSGEIIKSGRGYTLAEPAPE
ncbi:MAG TPA: hypothetical protein VIJ51_04650 [Solirubrobacteraceae bacterium]